MTQFRLLSTCQRRSSVASWLSLMRCVCGCGLCETCRIRAQRPGVLLSAPALKFTVFDDWKAWVGAMGRIFSFYLGFRIEAAAVADDWVLWEQAGWVKLLS